MAANRNEYQKAFFRAARNGNITKLNECFAAGVKVNACNQNGLNALHLASKEGRLDVIREVLARGALVDQDTKKGNTALHVASLAGHLAVVQELVKRGANVNKQSHAGFTPLYMAAQENHIPVVSYLLDHGADQSLSTEDGFTPMAVAKQQGHKSVIALLHEAEKNKDRPRLPELHIAAKKNDAAKIEEILKTDLPVNHQTTNGFTALHVAAHYGSDEAAKALLNKGADVNSQAKNDVTPLHVAAKMGRTSTLQLLLESGAFNQALNGEGFSPLHYACRYNHASVADVLIQSGACIDGKTRTGLTPLHLTCMGDSIDCGTILINNRANINETSVDLLTPLHVAAHCGSVGMAQLLLEARCVVDPQALNRFTPLHIAVKKGKVDLVQLFLSHVPDVDALTEDDFTALHVASFTGMTEMIEPLLDANADPRKSTGFQENVFHLCARGGHNVILKKFTTKDVPGVDDKSKDGLTPLHLACIYGNVDVVETLLQNGADLNATTFGELTPLHLAANAGKDDIVSVLVKHGASEGALSEDGLTALFLAIKEGRTGAVQQLIHTSECSNDEWLSPLHVAVHYNRQDMAAIVLQNGVDPMVSSEDGFTALHFAVYENLLDMTELLLAYTRDSLSTTALKMLLQERSESGYSPLHLAVVLGYLKMCRLLLRFGASVDYEMLDGYRPLHITAQKDDVELAQELLNHGADPNAASDSGYTCLHVASYWGRAHFVQFLLTANTKSHVNLNAQSQSGMTALHVAAQQGHLVLVQLLLQQNDLDANVLNKNGWTAAQVALFHGHLAIYTLLQKFTTVISNWEEEERKASQMSEEGQHIEVDTLEGEFGSGVFKFLVHQSNAEPITRLPATSYLNEEPFYLTNEYVASLLEYASTQSETVESKRMSAPVETYDTLKIFKEDKTPLPSEPVVVPKAVKIVESVVVNPIKDSAPLQMKKQPVSNGFLVSFMVDARGGILRSKRNPKFRILIPPNSTSQPVRVICRLVKPQRFCNPIPMHDGNGFACRIIELSALNTRFSEPIVFEMPHFASLRGRARELIVFRSENAETWKEHASEINESALCDWYGDHEIPSATELEKQNILRIVATELPTYFAVVTRIRQENVLVGKEGGSINSSTVARVQTVFPEGALQKRIRVGLQAQAMNGDIVKQVLENYHIGAHVNFSPIVTIEPRRRKFHRPITITIPLGTGGDASDSRKNSVKPGPSELRLFCSISGSGTPTEWEDITGSTLLMRTQQDCVNFTTTVSARFWIIECLKSVSVDLVEIASRIYSEINRVPYMGRLAIYHRPGSLQEQPENGEGSNAELRALCLIDDNEQKTLEHLQGFNLIGKSEPVEVIHDQIHQIELQPPSSKPSTPKNKLLRPVLFNNVQQSPKSDSEQRIFYPLPVRAFYECRSGNIPLTGECGDVSLWPPGYTMELADPSSSDGRPPLTKVPICLSDDFAFSDQVLETSAEFDNKPEELSPTVYPRKKDDTDEVDKCSQVIADFPHHEKKHEGELKSVVEELVCPVQLRGRECVNINDIRGEALRDDESHSPVKCDVTSSEHDTPSKMEVPVAKEESYDGNRPHHDKEAHGADKISQRNEHFHQLPPKSSTMESTFSEKKKMLESPVISMKSSTSQKPSPSMTGSGTRMTVDDSDFDMLLDVSDHSHALLSEEETDAQTERSFEEAYQQALHSFDAKEKPRRDSKEKLGSNPPSPSRVPRDVYEIIESDPQEKTHIEETEETLPDGTVVKRRIIQKEVTQVITERDYKEHYPSEDEEGWPDTDEGVTSSPGMSTPMSGSFYQYGSSIGGGSSISRNTGTPSMDQPQILLAACFQNPPNLYMPGSNATLSSHTVNADEPEEEINVEEIEEVLPDGTVVHRVVTTRKIKQKVTEKFVLEEDLDDEDDNEEYDETDGEETTGELLQENIETQN